MATFASATVDERWRRGRRTDTRLEHGFARKDGLRVRASDARDDELVVLVSGNAAVHQQFAAAVADGNVRIVATARRVGSQVIASTVITISIGGVSVVALPEQAPTTLEMLRTLLRGETGTRRELHMNGLPIVWQNGSGAVLLHEAVGHAAEEEATPVRWPEWLSVRDEPLIGIDDCGFVPEVADLTRSAPSALRRESFRDLPLRRMTRLVARQQGAPGDLPDDRVDIHLLGGGRFDPVTDLVEIQVTVADVVRGDEVKRLQPFTFARRREEIAQSLIAATGEPLRYPGVICSREGQEVFVESFAPLLVTT